MAVANRKEIPLISFPRKPTSRKAGPSLKRRKIGFEKMTRDPFLELQNLKDSFSREEFAAMLATITELLKQNAQTAVDVIVTDVFSNETPVFLRLLGREEELAMRREDFIDELMSVVELRHPSGVFSGTYIYSITVTDPEKPHDRFDQSVWGWLPLNFQSEARVGYLNHELIYSLPQDQLRELLVRFVAQSNKVALSLKPNVSEFSTRKQVVLC